MQLYSVQLIQLSQTVHKKKKNTCWDLSIFISVDGRKFCIQPNSFETFRIISFSIVWKVRFWVTHLWHIFLLIFCSYSCVLFTPMTAGKLVLPWDDVARVSIKSRKVSASVSLRSDLCSLASHIPAWRASLLYVELNTVWHFSNRECHFFLYCWIYIRHTGPIWSKWNSLSFLT